MPHPTGGYKLDGESIPGTTTITGRFKDSGALIYWGWKRGKDFPDEDLYETRDRAGSLGTIVHEMVEHFIGDGDEMALTLHLEPKDRTQVMSAFDAFKEWFDMNQFKVVAQEVQLMSRIHRYGGTLDAVAEDSKGRLVLLDWKTSDSIYPEMLEQLAAYRILWDENNPKNPLTGGSHLSR